MPERAGIRRTPEEPAATGHRRLEFARWLVQTGRRQLTLYQEILPGFRRLGAALVGISVDGMWCHLAFAMDRRLRFPLLSDFEAKGAVSRQYGAYRHDAGESARALFVIDARGVIRWSHLSPVGVNPSADGVLAALDTLQDEERAL